MVVAALPGSQCTALNDAPRCTGESSSGAPDLAMPEPLASDKVSPASPGTPFPNLSNPHQTNSLGRVVLGWGEPEPPISARPDRVSALLSEPKRISLRSPRAALEPDHVPVPAGQTSPFPSRENSPGHRRNAIFTVLILLLIAGGGAAVLGKSRLETPGPLQEDKVVSIPRSGMLDIADQLKREGVIEEHRFIFLAGVFVLSGRSELKAGEYLFTKHASVREVVETIMEGKVIQHQLTIPEGLTSEQIVARLLEDEILTGNIKEVPREGSLRRTATIFIAGSRANR